MAMVRHPQGYPSGTGSKVAIAGHPLHPLVVPIPIGSIVLLLCSDIAFYATGNPFWLEASRWLLVALLISGALAAVLGVIELLAIDRARRSGVGLAHGIGNVLLLATQLYNYRLRIDGGPEQIVPLGLGVTILGIVIVGVTGWLGGELMARHGVGVSPQVGNAPPSDVGRP